MQSVFVEKIVVVFRFLLFFDFLNILHFVFGREYFFLVKNVLPMVVWK
jgi:hypothetical protein